MPSQEQDLADQLIRLAHDQFDQNLMPGELRLLQIQRGLILPKEMTKRLPIRSLFIRWLLGPDIGSYLMAEGLIIAKAEILGEVILEGSILEKHLVFIDCIFGDTLHLEMAHLRSLTFGQTKLRDVRAPLAEVSESVLFKDCDCYGPVSFQGARIGSSFLCETVSFHDSKTAFDLSGAEVAGELLIVNSRAAGTVSMGGIYAGKSAIIGDTTFAGTGISLNLNSAKAGGNFDLGGIKTAGTILFTSARVGGLVTFRGAVLNATGVALDLTGTTIESDLVLSGITSTGNINMFEAKVGGTLWCDNAKILSSGESLSLKHAVVENSVLLTPSFSSAGTVRATGVQIGGVLDLTGAQLNGKTLAMELNDAVIKGSLVADALQSGGPIYLRAGFVGGNVQCNGAQFTSSPDALSLESTIIQHNVFLRNGFRSNGQVILTASQVGNDLDCVGAKFFGSNPGLRIDRATIGGAVFLRSEESSDFQCPDGVRAVQTKIAGDIDCSGALIGTIDLSGGSIGGRFCWGGIRNANRSEVFLIGANVASIDDDQPSWPSPGKLHIDGLVYRDLVLHVLPTKVQLNNQMMGAVLPLDPDGRVAWLKLQPEKEQLYSGPWNQLAELLVSKGNPAGARHVLYEYELLQARVGKARWRPARALGSWLIENPFRSVEFIGGLWLIGFIVFWRYKRMMVPSDPDAYERFKEGELPPHYVRFHPGIYSLENVLPVVRLGQDSAWRADPGFRFDLRRFKKRKRLFRKFRESGHPNLWYFWLMRLPFWVRHVVRKVIPRFIHGAIQRIKHLWVKCRALYSLSSPGTEARAVHISTRPAPYFALSLMRWVLIIAGWVLALVFAAAITRYFKP